MSSSHYRKLTLTVISAINLKNVRKVFKNKVYARVIIGGNRETTWRTTSDKRNGLNPAWNQTVEFDILETGIKQHGLTLVIKMYSSRKFGDDKYIGEVNTSIKELYDYANANGRGGSAISSLESNTGGTLMFSYSFGRKCKDETQSFFKWLLQTGATIVLRERVGKLVIDILRHPFSWGREPPEPPLWFGSARLIRERPIADLRFRGFWRN